VVITLDFESSILSSNLRWRKNILTCHLQIGDNMQNKSLFVVL
jgi:hypothetical protein